MAEWTMDKPVGETRLERSVQGLLGEPVDRYEGRLKVSGTANYTLDETIDGICAHGYAITATIGHGAVRGFDIKAAKAMPGVIDVIVDDPRIIRSSVGFTDVNVVAGNGVVDHYGQSLGIVVADSFENARAAANAVIVH